MKNKKKKLGDCFKASADFILSNPKATYCVAMVSGQGELKGTRFVHAFCEIGELVYDYSNGKKLIINKLIYYSIGNIERVKYYTMEEVACSLLKYKYYGLWEDGKQETEINLNELFNQITNKRKVQK